ncbi:MAG: spore germination protein [Clostridia bacterium]|nr:spore germination protein [Clostridia bacterium]
MIKNQTSDGVAEKLGEIFDKCGDFNIRKIYSGDKLFYLKNLGAFSGRDYISENIAKQLVSSDVKIIHNESMLGIITTSEVKEVCSAEQASQFLLGGFAVVFTDIPGGVSAYACMARNDPGRSVSEPESETVVRGPREGFTEKAEDNTALIRKRLRTPKLKIVNLSVGSCSETNVRVLYLDGIADIKLVEDVIERIKGMSMPTVMDSGYIEQYLTGGKPALFTAVGNSEKPDKVASKISSGRVAVICDGSPVVLTVPYLFVEGLQSAEDYLKTPYYASFIRIIRFLSMLVSLYLPAFYIAVMEHHKNAVPYKLYLAMSDKRSDIPFSLFGELIVILVIFEFIREVGVRMPGPVGSAVSIVGGLVLGDAAISAGISSAPVIMVASLTAICTFIIPPFMNSTVLVRLINIVIARFFGVVGIAVSVSFLISHLAGKDSFGVPYMMPFSVKSASGALDGLLMSPAAAIKNSSGEMHTE